MSGGSDFIEELDLEGLDAEGLEQQWPVPGTFIVFVDDVHRSQDNRALVLKFEVAAGEFKGKKIDERLMDPASGKTADSAAKMKERKASFAKRLGLVPDEGWGAKTAVNWSHAIGRFAVIKVVKRKYKDKDDNEKESINVDWLGVWPLNHKDVSDATREIARAANIPVDGHPQQAAGQAQGDGQQVTQPARQTAPAGARQNFDDL